MRRVGKTYFVRRLRERGAARDDFHGARKPQPEKIGFERQAGLLDEQVAKTTSRKPTDCERVGQADWLVDLLSRPGDHLADARIGVTRYRPGAQYQQQFAAKRDQRVIILCRGRSRQSLAKITDGLSLDRNEVSFCKQASRDRTTSLALGFDEDDPRQPLCIDDMLCVSGDGCYLAADMCILCVQPKPAAKREGNLNGMMCVKGGAPGLALPGLSGVDHPEACPLPHYDPDARQRFHSDKLNRIAGKHIALLA